KKNFDDPLTRVGSFEYHNNLYGDAARGCHHRGDGPDASEPSISYNRQRFEVLVIEASQRNPLGCRGGTCRRVREQRLNKRGDHRTYGTSGPYHLEKEVDNMAAKKKAAKKPAAKKAAAKKKR
ncbi:MAG TPA: hypothetical protein VET26_05875, partial [Candidatus Sulfotelmatobacter sp.]|nr:hypothetical protein [Candidatus Sulfotelmatobacter sp.]